MLYELITESDYDALPDEPDLRFVAFESICRASMTRLITQHTSPQADTFVRLQYMTQVAGAAESLNIAGVQYPDWLDDPADGLTIFMLSVGRAVAQIRLRSHGANKALSVRLGVKTRGKIEQQIKVLRDIIAAEPMSEEKRSSLLKRLDELSTELSQSRVNLGKVMAVLARVSFAVVSGTSFLANAPHAIATISSLLGADKEAEEAEIQRLGPPPTKKALPPQNDSSKQHAGGRIVQILDDDIPF